MSSRKRARTPMGLSINGKFVKIYKKGNHLQKLEFKSLFDYLDFNNLGVLCQVKGNSSQLVDIKALALEEMAYASAKEITFLSVVGGG